MQEEFPNTAFSPNGLYLLLVLDETSVDLYLLSVPWDMRTATRLLSDDYPFQDAKKDRHINKTIKQLLRKLLGSC